MSGLGVEALALALARVNCEHTPSRRPEDQAPFWLPTAYGLLASDWYAATVADVAERARDEALEQVARRVEAAGVRWTFTSIIAARIRALKDAPKETDHA